MTPFEEDVDALCSVEDVTRRLEDEYLPSPAMIEEGILYASDRAREAGSPTWLRDNVPNAVKRIVAAATARWVNNPGGHIASRAGDEMLGWGDSDDLGAITFTEAELNSLRSYCNHGQGFGSIGTYRHNRHRHDDTLWVEIQGVDGKPFPLFKLYGGVV